MASIEHVHKALLARSGDKQDVPPVPAITPVGASERDIFFPTEAYAAIAAVAPLNRDCCLVNEHINTPLAQIKKALGVGLFAF